MRFRPKFTIRDIFFLIIVVALSLALANATVNYHRERAQLIQTYEHKIKELETSVVDAQEQAELWQTRLKLRILEGSDHEEAKRRVLDAPMPKTNRPMTDPTSAHKPSTG